MYKIRGTLFAYLGYCYQSKTCEFIAPGETVPNKPGQDQCDVRICGSKSTLETDVEKPA